MKLKKESDVLDDLNTQDFDDDPYVNCFGY